MRQPPPPTDASTSSAATAATDCRCGRCSCSNAAPGAHSHGSRTRAPRRRRRSPVAGSTSSAASTGGGRSRAWPSRSGSARRRWTRIPGPSAREHLAAAGVGWACLRRRRPRGRDRHEQDRLRGLRRRRQALAPARTAAGSPWRHGRGGARRAHRLGRRRGAGRHDPERLRLRRGQAALVAASGPPDATARTRRRCGQRPNLGGGRRSRAWPDSQRRGRIAEALEPAGAQHTDEQPRAQRARDDEADHREEVDADDLRAVVREDADQRRSQ